MEEIGEKNAHTSSQCGRNGLVGIGNALVVRERDEWNEQDNHCQEKHKLQIL